MKPLAEGPLIRLDAAASIPGSFAAPASRVYEYYNAEAKHWIKGMIVEVAPMKP